MKPLNPIPIKDMLPKKHVFQVSLTKNQEYEAQLDEYFKPGFIITKTEKLLDLAGVDRIFEHRKSHHKMSVEYKTDHASAKTGNFFVEMSVAEQKGWFFTSLCQVLIVFFPERKQIIRLDFLDFKRRFLESTKENSFPTKECKNETYSSIGQVVPVATLEQWGKVFSLL